MRGHSNRRQPPPPLLLPHLSCSSAVGASFRCRPWNLPFVAVIAVAGEGKRAGEEQQMATSCRDGVISGEADQASLEKKYGGITPKKKPLISKGSERAFFDSADWALHKQGAAATTAVETLRPKLQPTPHQRLPPRRPTCRSVGDDHEAE